MNLKSEKFNGGTPLNRNAPRCEWCNRDSQAHQGGMLGHPKVGFLTFDDFMWCFVLGLLCLELALLMFGLNGGKNLFYIMARHDVLWCFRFPSILGVFDSQPRMKRNALPQDETRLTSVWNLGWRGDVVGGSTQVGCGWVQTSDRPRQRLVVPWLSFKLCDIERL